MCVCVYNMSAQLRVCSEGLKPAAAWDGSIRCHQPSRTPPTIMAPKLVTPNKKEVSFLSWHSTSNPKNGDPYSSGPLHLPKKTYMKEPTQMNKFRSDAAAGPHHRDRPQPAAEIEPRTCCRLWGLDFLRRDFLFPWNLARTKPALQGNFQEQLMIYFFGSRFSKSNRQGKP